MITWIEIDLNAFSDNIRHIKTIVGNSVAIMPVLKADGYGHGLLPLAKKAVECGVDAIAIGSPEEGLLLRENGIAAKILALDGMIEGYEEDIIKNDIASVVSSDENIDMLASCSKRLGVKGKIHIKVDTGMGRLGVRPENFFKLLEKADKSGLDIEGLMTHYCSASCAKDEFTNLQINRFLAILSELEKRGYKIQLIHSANSGAILNYPSSYFNMVRPGIILYGSNPCDSSKEVFKPVMQFKTKIVHINTINRGESASYNRSFTATRDTKTAVIPVGYAYGYNRLLSNNIDVLIKGKRARQIGNVCMDLTILDITGIDANIGDEVVLIGRQNDEVITIEEVAKRSKTISYETMCILGNSVKRIYKG